MKIKTQSKNTEDSIDNIAHHDIAMSFLHFAASREALGKSEDFKEDIDILSGNFGVGGAYYGLE